MGSSAPEHPADTDPQRLRARRMGLGDAMTLVYESGAAGTDCAVLLCLVHSGDWTAPGGETGISTDGLASRTGIARSAVVQSLERLVDAGVVVTRQRLGTSAMRRIVWDQLAIYTSPKSTKGGKRPPPAGLTDGRAGLTDGRAGLTDGRAGLTDGRAGLTDGRSLVLMSSASVLPGSTHDAPGRVCVTTRPDDGPPLRPDVLAVWSLYRQLQQDVCGMDTADRPPDSWGVERRVADGRLGVEGMSTILRWAHLSTHPRAIHLRTMGYTGATLFNVDKVVEYAPLAAKWRESGEHVDPAVRSRLRAKLDTGAAPPAARATKPRFTTSPELAETWRGLLDALRREIDPDEVAVWIENACVMPRAGVIATRDQYVMDWVVEHYHDAIADALGIDDPEFTLNELVPVEAPGPADRDVGPAPSRASPPAPRDAPGRALPTRRVPAP